MLVARCELSAYYFLGHSFHFSSETIIICNQPTSQTIFFNEWHFPKKNRKKNFVVPPFSLHRNSEWNIIFFEGLIECHNNSENNENNEKFRMTESHKSLKQAKKNKNKNKLCHSCLSSSFIHSFIQWIFKKIKNKQNSLQVLWWNWKFLSFFFCLLQFQNLNDKRLSLSLSLPFFTWHVYLDMMMVYSSSSIFTFVSSSSTSLFVLIPKKKKFLLLLCFLFFELDNWDVNSSWLLVVWLDWCWWWFFFYFETKTIRPFIHSFILFIHFLT